jgi:hypothetical protein
MILRVQETESAPEYRTRIYFGPFSGKPDDGGLCPAEGVGPSMPS